MHAGLGSRSFIQDVRQDALKSDVIGPLKWVIGISIPAGVLGKAALRRQCRVHCVWCRDSASWLHGEELLRTQST